MDFANLIKSIRRKNLLNQDDFVQIFGFSSSTFYRWENGKLVPKLCNLNLVNDFCVERSIPSDMEKFITNFESNIARTE